MSLCRNCGFDPPTARGLCPACLKHEQRKGTPRPADLILRHIDRKTEQAAAEQIPDPTWMVDNRGRMSNHQAGRRRTGVRHWRKRG